MLCLVFVGFTVFFVIMTRQTHSAMHYVGFFNRVRPKLIKIYAILDEIFAVYYAVRCSISFKWYAGPLLLLCGFIFTLITNEADRACIKIRHKKDLEIVRNIPALYKELFDGYVDYNSTIVAETGLIINPVLAVLLHLAL